MKKIGITCRAIVLDKKTKRLLLVRNKGGNFWYPPGGELEDNEKIVDCIVREVREETGINVITDRLFYVQYFSPTAKKLNIELFWSAYPIGSTELLKTHFDVGGIVEECRWFSKDEIQVLEVYPKKLKKQFWIDFEVLLLIPNLFIT